MHSELAAALHKARKLAGKSTAKGPAVHQPDQNDDPRTDVPPVESADEFGIETKPHSDADLSGTKSKNALVAFPLQAFENIRIDKERRGYLIKGLIASTGLAVIWGPPNVENLFWQPISACT